MLRRTRPLLLAGQRPIPRPSAFLRPATQASTPSTYSQWQKLQSSHFTSRSTPLLDKIDREHEKKIGQQKIKPRPDEVTIDSSRRAVFEPSSSSGKDADRDVVVDLKQDIDTIKGAIALNSVPPEPYALGLAGTLPYLGTSLATVYLSWDLNQTWPLSNALLNTLYINHDTAQYWLGLLEPIQLGYGAVIISFLGAIHWGMEWADSTSQPPSASRARYRYLVGVLAPAVAWPTLLMPVEYALISQFAAFTGLYFVDTRAASRGWTPAWYATYRFVLTFIVGSAIVVSLVGRAKIMDKSGTLTTEGLRERLNPAHPEREDVDWVKVEKEEKEKIKAEEEEKRKKEEEAKAKTKGKGKGKGKEKDEKKGKQDDKEDEDGDGKSSESAKKDKDKKQD